MRLSKKERAQGATEYLLMLAAVLVIVAVAVYYVMTAGGYPAVAATAVRADNDIRINVESGSIPTGDWQYSVSSTSGSYSWTDGTETLDAPYVTIASDQAAGTYYVSLKHKPSGHIYFADTKIDIS
jgi:hypothetical protein